MGDVDVAEDGRTAPNTDQLRENMPGLGEIERGGELGSYFYFLDEGSTSSQFFYQWNYTLITELFHKGRTRLERTGCKIFLCQNQETT